jgi:hypothetical protein
MVRKKTKDLRNKTLREPSVHTQTLTSSEGDRRAFFAALIDPPKASARLVRALAEHKRRIVR